MNTTQGDYIMKTITSQESWENFTASKNALWKECKQECNSWDFFPSTIKYSEWDVRNEEGDIVASGDKKPTKQDIIKWGLMGITIRLSAFNKHEEWTIITFFDGKEWIYEEAV
jgi:hypothetical protein